MPAPASAERSHSPAQYPPRPALSTTRRRSRAPGPTCGPESVLQTERSVSSEPLVAQLRSSVKRSSWLRRVKVADPFASADMSPERPRVTSRASVVQALTSALVSPNGSRTRLARYATSRPERTPPDQSRTSARSPHQPPLVVLRAPMYAVAVDPVARTVVAPLTSAPST